MPRPAVHPLLAAAHLAIDPRTERWNPQAQSLTTWELPHLGGPQPLVPRRAQAELVLWCAETVAPLIALLSARTELIDLIGAARAPGFATDPARNEVVRRMRALEPRAQILTYDDPLLIAGVAAAAASRIATHSWRNAQRTAIQAVVYTTRILLRARNQKQRGVMTPEAFIDALDAKLVRAEWAGLADRTLTSRRLHGEAGARLDSVLYRAGDEKGDGVVWVARLKASAGTTIAALVRRRGFHYAEGTPSDALVIVPDEYMASATAAVFAPQA